MMRLRANISFGLFLALLILLTSTKTVFAEYRAYLIEVFDHISEKKWEAITGFSPDKYVLTHGGGNRLSVFTKATWVCYGDTATFSPACPMPDPIKPNFRVGDRVKVNLEKHPTKGWLGMVELAYYQKGVKSNVYGVRFGDKRSLYNRYFEFNLEKVTGAAVAPPDVKSEEAAPPAQTTETEPTVTAAPAPAEQ